MRALPLTLRLLPLATLLAAGIPATASPMQDPEAVARRADEALAALRTLEASFVQRVANPILEKTEIGHGTLYYRAPGR